MGRMRDKLAGWLVSFHDFDFDFISVGPFREIAKRTQTQTRLKAETGVRRFMLTPITIAFSSSSEFFKFDISTLRVLF